MTTATKAKSNLRTRTLVLLWVWAICIFTVVDLFLNVGEFDGIRPRAAIYRGMRVAAHKMVGEPVDGQETLVPAATRRPAAERLAEELDEVRGSNDDALLRGRATAASDPRVRIAALERLGSRDVLVHAANDIDETPKVRRAAARLLGRFGTMEDLERILGAELPAVVRDGAILGMGELGTMEAAEKLLELAAERGTAVRALALISNPKAGPALRLAVLDAKVPAEARVAICSALSRIPAPATTRTLTDVLANPQSPPDVRAMAANSLGRLRDPTALATILAATNDGDPAVARQARLTRTRLSHVK